MLLLMLLQMLLLLLLPLLLPLCCCRGAAAAAADYVSILGAVSDTNPPETRPLLAIFLAVGTPNHAHDDHSQA